MAPEFTGTQLAGEFLSTTKKLIPFFCFLAALYLILIVNSERYIIATSIAYLGTTIRITHRFLSHK
jgi:hypothetical protein